MRKYDFTVIGGVCSVQLLKVHSFPQPGRSETVLNTNSFDYDFGGCSYNIFAGLAKLGMRIYPVIASNSPSCTDALYRECQDYGFPTDALMPHDDRDYYHCIMLQDDNGKHMTLSLFCGEDAVIGKTGGTQPLLDEYFRDSDYVLIAVGDSRYQEIIDKAKKFGTKLVYSYRNDPVLAPVDMIREILAASSFIFTNEVEAAYIENVLGLGKITDLFEKGMAEVIVTTLGEQGSIVYQKCADGIHRERISITPAPLDDPNTVGAGDGFVSGFMTGWARGESVKVCAQYGSTVSSFVLEKEGAVSNLPTFEQMLERNRTRPDAE